MNIQNSTNAQSPVYLSKTTILLEVTFLVITLLGISVSIGGVLQLLPSYALLPGEVTAILGASTLIISILVLSCRGRNDKKIERDALQPKPEQIISDTSQVSTSQDATLKPSPSQRDAEPVEDYPTEKPDPSTSSLTYLLTPSFTVERDSSAYPLDNTLTLINNFPNEILAAIFSFLKPSELYKVSLVNKKWSQVSENEMVWKIAFEKRWPKCAKIIYPKTCTWKERCKSLTKNNLVIPLALKDKKITRVAIQGDILFTTEKNNSVELWDLSTGVLLKKMEDPNNKSSITSFSVHGDYLVILDSSGSLKIGNINTGEIIEVDKTVKPPIPFITAIEGQSLFYINTSSKELKIFDLETKRVKEEKGLKKIAESIAKESFLLSLAVSEKFIVIGGRKNIYVCSRDENPILHEISEGNPYYYELYFHNDLLVGVFSLNGHIIIWDLNDYQKKVLERNDLTPYLHPYERGSYSQKTLRENSSHGVEDLILSSSKDGDRLALSVGSQEDENKVWSLEVWSLTSHKLLFKQKVSELVSSIALQNKLLICNGKEKMIYHLPD